MASKGGIKDRGALTIAQSLQLTPEERARLGVSMASIVVKRAFPQKSAGRDEFDVPYPPYSTRPIYVAKAKKRKGVKGGRDPEMPYPAGGEKPRTKRTAADAKTVFYPGGYSQYRRDIGRSSGANKNLILTGMTYQAFKYLRSSLKSIVIGFFNRRERAANLDANWKFMGLTPKEKERARNMWAAIITTRRR